MKIAKMDGRMTPSSKHKVTSKLRKRETGPHPSGSRQEAMQESGKLNLDFIALWHQGAPVPPFSESYWLARK